MAEILYLSGGMSGLTVEESNGWRIKVKQDLFAFILNGTLKVFNPMDTYIHNEYRMNEKEAMRYDLNILRKSSYVLVYFNDTNSLGTAMEIAIAHELKIPIIGVFDEKEDYNALDTLHPWVYNMCDVVLQSLDDAIRYIKNNYLQIY